MTTPDSAGLDSQNGASGTIVLHARDGDIGRFRTRVQPALQQLCAPGLDLASVESPYGTVDCATGRATADPAGQAALTSPDRTIGLVNLTWTDAQPEPDKIDGVVERAGPGRP